MTKQQDGTRTDEKTPHRKECEHRAWEIIRDAHIPVDWAGGKLEIDFSHLANDIADTIESDENEAKAYKSAYEEAMKLLGIAGYGTGGQSERSPADDRNETWWVRFEGDVVAAEVRFRDGEPKEVAFFGTDYFAKAEDAELLSMISPLPGPIRPVYDGPEDVVRGKREEMTGRVLKGPQGRYAIGYLEACDDITKVFDEVKETGRPVDHASCVASVLDRFNRLVAGTMSDYYEAGYRDACRQVDVGIRALPDQVPGAGGMKP